MTGKKLLVANLYGAPGAGKSTAAAEIFSSLKKSGVSCELVTEVVKEMIWDNNLAPLASQLYVFSRQYHRLWRLAGKVDIAICEWPLLHALVYDPGEPASFKKYVMDKYDEFANLDILLLGDLSRRFDSTGRIHTAGEACEIEKKIIAMLKEAKIGFVPMAGPDSVKNILEMINMEVEFRR